MTAGELETAIDEALSEVPFETLDLAYCTAVRDALRPRVPGGQVEAFHRFTELVVEVRASDRIVRRVLPVG